MLIKNCRRGLIVSALLFAVAGLSVAGVPAGKTAGESGNHRVMKSVFKIEVTLDGIFEAQAMSEVVLRPEVWSKLKVVKAVEQGTRVKQGQPLVWLETKEIDQEIQNLEYSRGLSVLTLRKTEQELQALVESTPLDLTSSERAKKIADEDLEYFLKVDRPLSEKSARHSLERSQFSLEYAEEELNQLEKMYKADDLTEETEEIILKRAKRTVDSSRFYLEQARIRTDQTLKVTIPRKLETLTDAARRQAISFAKSRVTLPAALEQKHIEFEKAKFERTKLNERLARLQQDRKLLTVRAPADGIVYYGQCTRGKWSGGTTVQPQLREGGTLKANQVFMTIVEPKDLFVRVEVPEKELQHLRPGTAGKVVPTAFPQLRLAAKLEHIASIPLTAGKFDGRISIGQNKKESRIVAGMACKVKLMPYLNKEAIAVPAAAVFADDLDDQKRYVYLAAEEGRQQEKRPVKVGKQTDKQVEILEGLTVGDVILLKKPDEK